MKLGSLISGGKDSIFSICLSEKRNHTVNVLLGIKSQNPNSWMFHTQNIDLIELQAESMGKKLVYKRSEGKKEKELEDLEELVEKAIEDFEIKGLVVGAIESQYQRERVERICEKLGLEVITPLWNMDEEKYLKNLIESNFEVIITKVAAGGLGKDWLGRRINKKTLQELKEIRRNYGIHLAGEGGEYETLVLDCPLFKRRIEIEDAKVNWNENRGIYNIKRAILSS